MVEEEGTDKIQFDALITSYYKTLLPLFEIHVVYEMQIYFEKGEKKSSERTSVTSNTGVRHRQTGKQDRMLERQRGEVIPNGGKTENQECKYTLIFLLPKTDKTTYPLIFSNFLL